MNSNSLNEETRLLLDSESEPQRSGKTRPGRWLLALIIVGAISYGGYRVWGRTAKPADAVNTQSSDTGGRGRGGRGGRGGGGGGRAAVVTVAARKVDMPVYLRGLGTAGAFNTVTVRSRVDGQLVRVAYREGQFVNKGDLLAEIDTRPFEVQLAQAKGQLARDEALLRDSQVKLDRNKLLDTKGLIAKQDVDSSIATLQQYEGSIQADQALIANANLQITYSKITAPISGQIGLRLVDEGNIVRSADPNGIVVITQLQPISILFSIPEDNLGDILKKLRAGQQLRVEAWDHDDIKKIGDGILLTADNQIDPTTGTSKLKAVFDNRNNALYPNQFVNVRLLIDTLKNAVVVPSATIQRGAQGTFLWVVDENNTSRLRPVTIKNIEGNDAALASGLEGGELVVLEGMDKVQDGARVDVQKPGETPGDSTSAKGGGGGRRGGRGGRGRGQSQGQKDGQ